MHELALTSAIVDVVAERAAGARVVRVIVEIGKLCCAEPEAVRFAFQVCTEGTELAGAELEIREPRGRGKCRACGIELSLQSAFTRCSCGSMDLDWQGGDELKVLAMEVERCVESAAAAR